MQSQPIHWTDGTDYGFAIGRMRSIEQGLLDPPRYDRLLRAKEQAEFVGLLKETAYARQLDATGGDWEATISAARTETMSMLPVEPKDHWLSEFLNLAEQVQLQKQRRREADHQIENADPAKADNQLDHQEQVQALTLAQGRGFVMAYLRLHADLNNVSNAIRAGATEANENGSLEPLPGGGLIGELELRIPVDDTSSTEGLFGPYQKLFGEALQYYRQHNSFVRMERLCREAELRHWRRARYCTFGYEPLLAFYFLRQNELTNLRLLYAATPTPLDAEYRRELVAYVE